MPDSSRTKRSELYLEVVKGINPGALYPLEKPAVIVGRGEECDIVIPQRQVSTSHCRIRIEGGDVLVEDFGSSNGTYLNDSLIGTVEKFTQNSRLLVGHTVMRLVRRQPGSVRREADWFNGATMDLLTGVPTLPMFRKVAEQMIPLARRRKWWVSLLLFDVDGFHGVNSQYGIAAGDEVLRDLGRGLKNALRAEDLLARFGEEMFVALLLDTDLEKAVHIADRERLRVASKRFRHEHGAFTVSVSAGAAAGVERSALTLDRLLREADDALARAREEGRNRVCGNTLKKSESAETAATMHPPPGLPE